MGRLFPFASSQMLCFARDDELQARARVLLVPFPRRGNAAGTQETPISSRDSTPDSDRGVDARTARPSRAPRASVPDGVGLGEPAIANAKSHRTETDPSPPPLRHTRPRRTQTHTMPKKRRANGRNKPAGARGHVRAPSPRVSSDRNRARDRTRTARVFGPTRGPARRSRGPQRHTPRRPERIPSASRALARE